MRAHEQGVVAGASEGPAFATVPTMPAQMAGVAKLIGYARTLANGAAGISLIVIAAHVVLPEGSRPSDWLGSFTGTTHTAQLNAEREAQVRTAREVSDAQAGATARWQMEATISQTQQEQMARSLTSQTDAANLADLSCIGGAVLDALFERDTAQVASALKQACGVGNQIRDNVNRTLADQLRNGSSINQRSAPVSGPQR